MQLRDIPGIGDKTIETLAKAGINSVDTLLSTYPRTYRTYHATTVNEAHVGNWVVLRGTIKRPVSHRTGYASTQSTTFWDTTGSLTLRWFNMPYIVRSVDSSAMYLIKGQITEFAGKRQIVSPQLQKTASDSEPTDTIVPIYSSRSGVKPWIFRQKIAQTLDHIGTTLQDPLAPEIIDRYHLVDFNKAIHDIHTPASNEDIESAAHRLAFQELYTLQLSNLQGQKKSHKGIALTIDTTIIEQFLQGLPFTPTNSQRQVIAEIVSDLSQPRAMQRLVQGEVGSGKTIVAIASAIATVNAGYRTLVMAPTQILAMQLYDNFRRYCEPLGITVALVTAKSKSAETDIMVGTQALLYQEHTKIGLVIVDEQHRFGVDQRENWMTEGIAPHFLQMTATPIPRSLAQTLFHHLDITRLTDIPKNRLPTKTFVVPEAKRQDSYRWIRDEIQSHKNQAFVVVPLIEMAEENDTAPLKSLKEFEGLLKKQFSNLVVDIMHGKMTEKEKIDHMEAFKNGQTHILVATSMIEVGIDVPEANIIVIEDAERFGLAQLHQLRGRVGRGDKQGYCLLFTSSRTDKALDRLGYFVRESNGEKLAHYDLEHRGPGELFGTLQSGFFNLSLGSMYDEKLLEETYQAARHTLGLDKKP